MTLTKTWLLMMMVPKKGSAARWNGICIYNAVFVLGLDRYNECVGANSNYEPILRALIAELNWFVKNKEMRVRSVFIAKSTTKFTFLCYQ